MASSNIEFSLNPKFQASGTYGGGKNSRFRRIRLVRSNQPTIHEGPVVARSDFRLAWVDISDSPRNVVASACGNCLGDFGLFTGELPEQGAQGGDELEMDDTEEFDDEGEEDEIENIKSKILNFQNLYEDYSNVKPEDLWNAELTKLERIL
jgi:hypothetical protein